MGNLLLHIGQDTNSTWLSVTVSFDIYNRGQYYEAILTKNNILNNMLSFFAEARLGIHSHKNVTTTEVH